MDEPGLSPLLPKWLRLLPAGYLLVGLVWIVASDLIIGRLLHHDLKTLVYAGTFKGALFVILTSALLYIAIATSRGSGKELARVLPAMTPGKPLAGFLLVGLGIAAAGYVVYLFEVAGLRERSERQVAATAEMTAVAVAIWREAKLASMSQVASSPFTGPTLADWRRGGSELLAAMLTERLSAIRSSSAFESTAFVDAGGKALLTVGGAVHTSTPEIRDAIRRSLGSDRVIVLALTEPVKPGLTSEQVIFVAPVSDGESSDPGGANALVARAPVEAAMRQVQSANLGNFDTLTANLVRRDRDGTVLLQPATGPGAHLEAVRTTTKRADGLAARALSDQSPVFRSFDALDRPVLAASRAVAGTPYFAVATIELAEIRQQMRRMMLLIGGMSAFGFLAAGTLVLPWWLVERARTRSMLEQVHSRAENLATRLDWVTRHANDVILLLDEDGRILDANERAEEMYGYSPRELLLMNAFQLRPGDPVARTAARSQFETIRQRGSLVFEDTHVRKDGTTVPVEVSSRFVELGTKRYVQSIVRDISQRRVAEQRLRESEAQYRLLFESNPHPMWVYDPASLQFLAVNDAAIAEYGYSRREFLAMTLADIRPMEDLPRLRADVREHAKDVLQHSGIWRHLRKDGSIVSVEIDSHSLEFDGRPARLVRSTNVTARLRAEAALRASEERYRHLFEQASDGVVVIDGHDRIVAVNAEMVVLTGYTREELRGMALPALIDSKEHARLTQVTEARRRGVLPGPGTWMHRRKDGGTFPAEVRVRPLPGGELLATIRDLTAILAARRRIERQRDLYDLLSQCNQAIAQIGDRAALFDRLCRLAVERGRFLFACVGMVAPDGSVVPIARSGDEQGCSPTGTPLTEVVLTEALRSGRPVILNDCQRDPRFRGPQDSAACRAIGAMAAFPVHAKSGVSAVLTLYGRKTGEFDAEIAATLQEVAADVSHALDAMQTRRELEENRLLLQSIINASDALIYACDTEGRVILINESAARAMGSSRTMLVGRNRQELLPPEIEDVLAANDQQVVRNGAPLMFEERNVEFGVERIYLSVKSPLRDIEGRIYAVGAISTDITELRRMQQELAATNARLEEKVAERTREAVAARERAEAADRAKSLFLSSMSHELRSPLHSIIGFTSVLLEGLEGDLTSVQQEHLRVVADASQHLLAIINDLLDMSRIEAGAVSLESSPLSVSKLLARILQRFRLQAEEKGLRFELVDEAGDLPIVGDERRIEQIVSNLVSNAIKYTVKGGLTVTSSIVGPELRIAVSDTGPGITIEDQARLFRYFSQVAPTGGRLNEGSGLGLAIARGLAEAMGGHVNLDSEPGRGSVFTLVLPVRRNEGN